MKKLLLFIPIIIFMSSCTITKRVHRSGYYISSNKNVKATKGKEESKAFIVDAKVDSTSLASNNKKEKIEVLINKKSNSYQYEKAEIKVVKTPFLKEKTKSFEKITAHKNYKTNVEQIETNNKNKVTNGFGLASFILGLLGLLVLMGFLFQIGGFLFASFAVPILVLFAVLALIFAIKAMAQQKRNPNKYKYKWMSIVGLVIGTATILSLIALIIIVIIVFI